MKNQVILRGQTAELHVPTYYSDGVQSPLTVANAAQGAGLGLLAVTDHDTVNAFEEVEKFCSERGIKAVSGIEISAYDGDVKVHTLGYNFNAGNADFKSFLKGLYLGSLKRAEEILFKLEKCGVKIAFEEAAAERFCENVPLHAMHIARAGCKKGYAPTPFAFYANYLALGKAGFCNACRPSPEEAVEVIRAAGGLASLAHPARIGLNKADLNALILRMKEVGLCGIEAVYSGHTKDETAYYRQLAEELELVVTGGSDTHRQEGNRKIGTPRFEPTEALLKYL